MSIFGATREVYKLFRMNIRNRYLGSKVGILWAVIQPLLMMMIYILIFGVVLQLKVEGSENSFDYVIWFICGFTPWMAINEGIMSTASSIISGISLVKNYAIKSELLPIASALMGLPQMLVGIAVTFILSFLSGRYLSWHIFWLVLIIPLMFLFIMGIGFFVSAMTVFIRDMIQIIPTFMQLLFYLTPIFYGSERFSGSVLILVFSNPFYQICNMFRQILFYHTNPDFLGILYIMVLSGLLWICGLVFFRKLKGFFESVL